MARRNDHTKDELKNIAIIAGQDIISCEGLNSFSARGVAKKIGYTVGTIYNIFGSHDELILSINAITLDDMQMFIIQNTDSKQTEDIQIKQLAIAYLRFAETNYFRWSALFEHSLQPDKKLPDWYSAKITNLFSLIEEPISFIVKDKNNTQKTSQTLWASIHGICSLGLTGKLDVIEADSVLVLIEELIDNYLKAIRL